MTATRAAVALATSVPPAVIVPAAAIVPPATVCDGGRAGGGTRADTNQLPQIVHRKRLTQLPTQAKLATQPTQPNQAIQYNQYNQYNHPKQAKLANQPNQPNQPKQAKPTRRPQRALHPRLAFGVAGMLLVGAIIASVAIGARGVGLDDLVGALMGHTNSIGEAAIAQRLPRTALALLVGAALSVAGLSLQSVTRNPLADPGILGITSGAALAVVTTITVLGARSPAAVTAAAVIGAAAAAGLLFVLSAVGPGGASPLKIVLSGAAISAMSVSVTSALILPRPDAMEAFRFWQIGGVGGAAWGSLVWSGPIIVVALLAAFAMTRSMNALALGDELAAGLGERLGLARFGITAGAIVLAGVATALAGPIGFVGLIVPHACRLIAGPDHRILLPLSAIGGAALLVFADVIGRVVMPPAEVEAGIITAIMGAPVLIWIVRRRPERAR